MGRPIRSDRMSVNNTFAETNEALSGKIGVTGYRPSGGSLVSSTTAYIVSQKGSRLFKIHLEDSSEAVYELKAVAPASLGNSSNQFCVQIILDDSTVAYVEKFYNNTIHYVVAVAGSEETDVGGTGSVKYTLGAEGTDEGGGSGTGEKDTRPNTGSIDVR
tara:strand:+ start:75 stop:554 length:480 start_codon:yes stop_codon:yes gene_type:complete